MSDGSGFKKKIHGGDGHDESKPGGGYPKGCAAFLEFHEASRIPMVNASAFPDATGHLYSHTLHSCAQISRPRVTIRC